MWSKIKHWLETPDDEGITGYDGICMFFWNLMAWGIPLTLIVLAKEGII